MRFTPGTRFGPYQITAPLGSGGMGEVYRATDTRLGREVALKLIRADSHSPATSRRFLNEALLLSRLTHANIATLYELDNANGVDFLVLELVTGETIAARIARGPLPEPEAVAIAAQTAAALEHAHERGIIHQDLKPANLIVTAGGLLKVLDFGVARVWQWTADAPTLMASNQGGGTPRYMAPEQLRGAETSAQTDIYCLGTVLYEMLTARRPFTGPTEAMVTNAILTAQPQPPSRWVPSLSPALDRIVLQCLARTRSARFATAAALREALHQCQQGSRTGTVYDLPATGAAPARSLVVLPAQVFGPDSERYLGDAIASTLATGLSDTRALEVRMSPLQADIERIPDGLTGAMRALAVDLFLLAHVIPQASLLAINLQLIESSTHKVLWSKDLETERGALLASLRTVARALAADLGAGPATPSPTPPPPSALSELPFQDALYRANAYMQRGQDADFEAATVTLGAFADSGYRTADAAAALARVYASALQHGLPPAEAVPALRQWAQRALAADRTCARAWAALSTAESLEISGFGKQLDYALRAAALAPQDAAAHLALSSALAHSSHLLTLAACRYIHHLDPLHVPAAIHEGTLQAMFGRRTEALNRIEHALTIAPQFPMAVIAKTAVLCLLDEPAAAGAWLAERVRPLVQQQRMPADWDYFFSAIVDCGTLSPQHARFPQARDFLIACATGAHPFTYWQVLTQGVSAILARTGDHLGTLTVLEARAAAGLLDPYDYFLLHRHFEALRPHPRFQAIAARSRGSLVTTLAALGRARDQGEFPAYLLEPWQQYAGLAEICADAVTEAPS
ncbi:MAG: protein kinase domain-containing protein [Terriglobales bacterium]